MFTAKNVLKTVQKGLYLTETTWRGNQPAWLIKCEKLELILTKHGLNIASVTHIDDPNQINPFWIPKWPWKSPIECKHLHIKDEDEQIYGNREDSQLLTNICGHSMCIDRFGMCKLTDEPRTCHGEAPVSEWELHECTNNIISFSVNLPLAKLYLKRCFNFENDVVYVTTFMNNISNRYVDFFESDDSEYDNRDQDRIERDEVKNKRTMNEMKSDITRERKIGNDQNINLNTSSFMNLPIDKSERKKVRKQRDTYNVHRTYDIVRSFMEDEYRQQHIDNMKNMLSPKKVLNMFKKKSYTQQLENNPNENDKLNDKLVQEQFNKKHKTWIEKKDEDLILKFKEDDRTRYDVEWTEHIIISDPFLNDAKFILPKDIMNKNISYNYPLEMNNSRFNGQNEISLKECLHIPKSDECDLKLTEASACYVDIEDDRTFAESNFIVRNEKLGFELEYEWNRKTFPWLCIWTEHYGNDFVPWNCKERCRGLEISTKPFPIPDLEKHLPEEEIGKYKDNEKVNCWNDKRIDFVLPHDGIAETFALRWSPIK